MINLLPPAALTTLQAYYVTRRRAVIILAFLFLLLITALLLGLLRYKIHSRLSEVATALATIEASAANQTLTELTASAANTKKELDLFATLETGAPTITTVLETLLAHQTTGLRLTDILYDAGDKELKLGLQGVAASRTVYLAWLKTLRADPKVVEVSAPLSDLIHDQNLRFSVALTLKHAP